jgi:hypothetical protein
LNAYKEKNYKLKEQMHRAQKNIEYKNLHIKELLARNHIQSSPKRGVTGLKQYVKELNVELEKLKVERNKLVQCNKITKLNEAMAELKATKEESNRLKIMLNDLLIKHIGNVPDKKKKLEEMKLMLENRELVKALERQEYELEKLKDISKRQQSKKKLKGSTGKRREGSSSSSTMEKNHIEKELQKLKGNLNKRILYIYFYRSLSSIKWRRDRKVKAL